MIELSIIVQSQVHIYDIIDNINIYIYITIVSILYGVILNANTST